MRFVLLLFSMSCLCLIAKAQETQIIQNEWLTTLNKSEDIQKHYLDQGVLLKNGALYRAEDIQSQWLQLQSLYGRILAIRDTEEFQLREDQKYETGVYSFEEVEYQYIIGWRNRGEWKKEVEIIYPILPHNFSGITSVDKERSNWEDYANNHQPNQLVDSVCSTEGYYVNRGNVYQEDQIKEAYSYMANPKWKIQLASLFSTQPNEDVIYDIGEFTSGGEGLYVLIWIKEEDVWRIKLDFNF